ncbi:acyltransferase [bacterium]|nr:acyltransferase [bacterium]
MRIGIYQFSPVFGDKKTNLNKIENAVAEVNADLLVLPELCISGYQFTSQKEVADLSDIVPDGESIKRLVTISKKTGTFIASGFVEQEDGKFYNSSVFAGPRGIVGIYRKNHLFYEEKEYFTPGNLGFPVFSIPGVKVGMMICFDWLFPEAARSLALKGADIILHPANLVLPFCQDAMITRCIENGVFAVTANRTGTEKRGGKPSLRFTGQSQVVNPKGEVLFKLGENVESVQVIEIDPSLAGNKMITDVNDIFLDRRPDIYIDDVPPEETAG